MLYVCPLKALLNNLQPRLASYAQWVGRRAEVWHGDVTASRRTHLLREPPDVLLTTPESLEAMLISTRVDADELFADLRAVVVDELHAFAGDDRGWHLLAVLARLSRLAGRPLQRVGLSATVGNPDELLRWLQGGGTDRPSSVVAPDVARGTGSGGGDAGPRRHGRQRRAGRRVVAPGREAAGLRRQPVGGRGGRTRPARAGGDDLPVPLLAVARRAAHGRRRPSPRPGTA